MNHKNKFIVKTIKKIKKNNLYRRMQNSSIEGPNITIGKKELVNFCSNDYLAITGPNVKINQIQSSSRLVSGNDVLFLELEKKLAKHKSQQDALIYPTGYMANLGSISALISKNDSILSDELNHVSIIEACKLSGANVSVYKHNDMSDLSSKIKRCTGRKFIISEGIFSMDGDYADLKSIVKIASNNNAFVVLDDAHGDFTVGTDGKGTANHFGVSKKIDLYISSLSKGLGSFGGYCASDKDTIDLFVNRSKSFIYTSALPAPLIQHSIQRFDTDREKQRKKLTTNVKLLATGLRKIGYQINSQTHIIPIILGNERKALEFGRFLYKYGIFVQPIRYPTVPLNQARIRLSVTAWLTKKRIEKAISVFEQAGKKFKIF